MIARFVEPGRPHPILAVILKHGISDVMNFLTLELPQIYNRFHHSTQPNDPPDDQMKA